ncbi:MAG: FAD-dependent oxidoreductase [bacterium]|nr:FAD-dependent oxidoreductase [bacterium]
MRIAIIGAGFVGLSSSYHLTKKGVNVTLFEKENFPGGMAVGFKPQKSLKNNWDWSLEKYYHHWFTNDCSALKLAKEINHDVIIKRPKTSVYVDDKILQLDSPISAIRFPALTVSERLRMSAVIGFLRYNPFWKKLEGLKTSEFLKRTMGKIAYEKIWEPQLKNKFGEYSKDISLSWFWARIKKRTPSLAYPKEGFLEFALSLVKKIKEQNGKVLFAAEIVEIKKDGNGMIIKNEKDEVFKFDKIIFTLPSFSLLKIVKFNSEYSKKLSELKGLGAINLVLRLKKQFLKDGTYWLSICDKKSPIMAIVEHTNYMDKKFYNGEHIVYLGNYLSLEHPYMTMDKEEILKIYDPFLKKINPGYQTSIIDSYLFKIPFAQPIIPTNYSLIIPEFETPIKNLYLANIQQIYPWDRGTNYAIELGEKIAERIV